MKLTSFLLVFLLNLNLFTEDLSFRNAAIVSIGCFSEKYSYTPSGDISEIIHTYSQNKDEKQAAVSFTYDKHGYLTAFKRSGKETRFYYDEKNRLGKKTNPDGANILYGYDDKDRITFIRSSDNSVNYVINYVDTESATTIISLDLLSSLKVVREIDLHGNVLSEIFPNDYCVTISYNKALLPEMLKISNLGAIEYQYEGTRLVAIRRLSPFLESYIHRYQYDPSGNVISEKLIGDLGEIHYSQKANSILCEGPDYFERVCKNDTGNVISHQIGNNLMAYEYDSFSQLMGFDPLNNPIDANINDQNELVKYNNISCSYDANGNIVEKRTDIKKTLFSYDALGRLTEIKSGSEKISFTYDIFNRRLAKTIVQNGKSRKETFLYFNNQELVVFSDNEFKEMRVPGKSTNSEIIKAIAIETKDATYAPIYTFHGNIAQLINIATKERFDFSTLDPFGSNLHAFPQSCSFIFASKYCDLETGLIYFKERYYDPELLRWLSPDPIPSTPNPYSYCLNNPFRYVDINGQFVIAIPLIWGTCSLIDVIIGTTLTAAATAVTVHYTQKIMYALNKKINDRKNRDPNWEPPYNGAELGNDPAKPPNNKFTWKGSDKPKTGKGSWVNGKTNERLHPDLKHPGPKKPHWDYWNKTTGDEIRLNTDGSWEYKK